MTMYMNGQRYSVQNHEQIVNDNKLLEIVTGSYLYGTNTESSDKDFCGVFIEPMEYLLSPFRNIEEVELSIKDKLESGKNSKDAIDIKYYGLKKFIKLASQCNPNIIEFLFVPKDKIIYKHPFFNIFLENRELFLHKGLVDRFMGYAFEQEKKMYVKSEHYLDIHQVWKSLKEEYNDLKHDTPICHTKTAKKHLEQTRFLLQHNPNNVEYLYKCGDLQFGETLHVKKVMELLNARMEKASYRKDMILDKKYDYKFASHVVRLLSEGHELMKYHTLTFPSDAVDDIMDIKCGKYTLSRVEEIIESWKQRFRTVEDSCNLPSRNANQDKIEKLTRQVQEQWYQMSKN